ncbi:cytochrome P450 [Streptomyces sp. SID8361]|uniref:cytochrome P450 n=1 Tax=Streptomyces sp. MnatMP-M27 TaxID=1839768 RepID=UPI00081E5A64|nr:cytochrome P450 [Streptomyces sp. MnatMP-M27]MYU12628.1 cytochrome P450 [Streptomyces sp. SID8361]SCF93538.1 cytochrome P450 monooxygenase OleP [Streptomyces sp. MnatMP-M27]
MTAWNQPVTRGCPSAAGTRDDTMAYPFPGVHTLELEPEYSPLLHGDRLHRVTMPHGGRAWLATRYAHVRQVLADPRFSRALANHGDAPRLSSEVLPETSMMAMDPPQHTRVRRALAHEFTSDRIELLRGRAAQLVDTLLDTMTEADRPADLLAHLAIPFPLLMVCELLGVPQTDRDTFTDLSAFLRSRGMSVRRRENARREFETYVESLLTGTRIDPAGLLARLRAAHEHDRDGLSVQEIIDVAIALLVGGVGSPSTLLASGVCMLLRQTDLVAALPNDPKLVEATVEELLRVVPVGVGGGFMRVAKEDVRVGATVVRRGEAVLPAMTAANRDPEIFPEAHQLRPERRSSSRHLGLGHGTHHCIGAHLARVELQTAIGILFHRLPGLRLAVPEPELQWHDGLVVRELKKLPVTW